MDSYTRIMTAWAHNEPDRVPIELEISPEAKEYPEARRIVDFIDNDADNFVGVSGPDWGFFGLPAKERQEIIEDRPGEYRRIRRSFQTCAGEFFAITKHNYGELCAREFHWERRYIHTLEDMHRLTDAQRGELSIDKDRYDKDIMKIGKRGVPIVGMLHPLGALVRTANMEEVYGWLAKEKKLMHRFLQVANEQVAATISKMGRCKMGSVFTVNAHEMLVPPWIGMSMFDEFVFPYDKYVNDTVHKFGGRVRAHCHGNCMSYLEKMNKMGLDALEPLESPPFGNVDLHQAKQLVGHRMLLSGNVPSQEFLAMTPQEVRKAVSYSIKAAAVGGGFSLRTTGGHAATNSVKTREQMIKVFSCIEAYIDAGLELGHYPIL